jgi:hypothetical protein
MRVIRTERYFNHSLTALASAALATVFLIACQQSQPSAATPAATQSKAAPAAAATKDVYVIFEGPWAFAPDPKDANSIVLLAPKTKHHRDLYVTASNHATLAAGIYDLSFPGHVGPGAQTYDPSILRATIDPKNVQRALDLKGDRYAIRLPKPEAFLPAHRNRNRAGATYPPDASTEKEYATAVSLRYNVGSLSGFSLSGTPDSGMFNPLLLQVDVPAIRFVVEPTEDDDVCNTHSRQAFHDLVQLVGVTLYIDFAENPSDCHDKDPQAPRGGKANANWASTGDRMTAALMENRAIQEADVTGGARPYQYLRTIAGGTIVRGIAQRLGVSMYFFGVSGIDCKGDILGGGP